MRDRRKEGQLIKRAITKALPHLQSLRVRAAKGSSFGWWYIDIEDYCAAGCSCVIESWGTRITCQPCQDKWSRITQTAEKATLDSGAHISKHYPDMGGEHNDILVQVSLNQPSPALKMVTDIVDKITNTKAARS